MKRLPPDGLKAVVWPVVAGHPDFHDGYTPIRLRHEFAPRTEPMRRLNIVVSETDERALRALLRKERWRVDVRTLACLEAELLYAAIVAPHEVPKDVVTMDSWVVYNDERTGVCSRVKLVYPQDAHGIGRVSVLSPLGTALLGVRAGQSVTWSGFDRQLKRLRVTSVPFQPERAGRYSAPPRTQTRPALRTSGLRVVAGPRAEE